MLERIATALIAGAAPLFGLLLRRSRRIRLREQVQSYTELATLVAPEDPEAALEFRALVSDMSRVLVDAERKALHRRFDPISLVALGFFITPSVALIIWAWGHHGWWVWVVLVPAGIWTLVWVIYGVSQLWKSTEAQAT